MLDSWDLLHMNHFFVSANIRATADFQRINIDDLNKIIASHTDFVEICDLRDCFIKWKSEKIAAAPSSSSFEDIAESDSLRAKSTDFPARVQFARNIEEPYKDFSEYMKKSLMSRIVLAKLKETNLLTSSQKALVIREAAEFILLNVQSFPQEFPRKSEYMYVAKQVQSLFAGVFSDSDLLGSQVKDDKGKIVSQKRGKLSQRIYDIKKLMDKKKKQKKGDSLVNESCADGIYQQVQYGTTEDLENEDPTSASEEEEVSTEASNALEFVKTHKGPESKILTEWKKSAVLRKIQDFDDFPSLKTSFGHKLIKWDFDNRYPGKSEDFRKQFESLKPKMLYQFNLEITDSIGQELLSVLGSNKNKIIENFLYLSLLPYLFQPVATRRNNMKKRSVNTSANFFFCHVKV